MPHNAIRSSRARHRGQMLRAIQSEQAMDRPRLAQALGITPAAVTGITQELMGAGLLQEGAGLPSAGPGRRAVALQLRTQGGYVLGLALNTFEQVLALADLSGRIVGVRHLRGALSATPQQLGQQMHSAGEALLAEAGVPSSRLFGTGLAIFGLLGTESQALGVELPRWDAAALEAELSEGLGVPARAVRLLEALNVAEGYEGVSRGMDRVLLVHVAAGMGSSLRVMGQPLPMGPSDPGIGCVQVPEGRIHPTCGRAHCLLGAASGRALLARLGRLPLEIQAGEDFARSAGLLQTLLQQARDGAPDAVAALQHGGGALGRALGSVAPLMAPEAVVLAGPVGTHPVYRAAVEAAYAQAQAGAQQPIPLLTSTLTNASGAVHTALNAFVYGALRLPGDPQQRGAQRHSA